MKFSEELEDVLKEIINIGVGRASSAISELLARPLVLSVPELHVFDLKEMKAYCDQLEHEKYVIVNQTLYSGLEGEGVLSFPFKNGKTLVDLLLEAAASSETSYNVLEIEAIQEVGNMAVNAVGSVISDMTGFHVLYKVPEVFFLEHPLPLDKLQEIKDEIAYCYATTIFKVEGIDIEGNITLVLPEQSLKKFEGRILETISA